MGKLSEEVARALKAAQVEPISVEVAGFDRRFVVVEQSMHDSAMAALELQRNVELIREGIANFEAGRAYPLDEAMDRIRDELGLRSRRQS